LEMDLASGLQVQASERFTAAHVVAREDVGAFWGLQQSEHERHETLVHTVRKEIGLEGESGAAADKALADLIKQPHELPDIDQWFVAIDSRGDQLFKKSEEAARASAAAAQLAPSDSASVAGYRVNDWLDRDRQDPGAQEYPIDDNV
jgi:hypothetical protein